MSKCSFCGREILNEEWIVDEDGYLVCPYCFHYFDEQTE
jgi:DNA-directed RNA polymerase subunit RPC12/RpoP